MKTQMAIGRAMIKNEIIKPGADQKDVLGRDETDPVKRLHAMAKDALARKNQDAVDAEVERAAALLGLKK
jgi:hypothetical protein